MKKIILGLFTLIVLTGCQSTTTTTTDNNQNNTDITTIKTDKTINNISGDKTNSGDNKILTGNNEKNILENKNIEINDKNGTIDTKSAFTDNDSKPLTYNDQNEGDMVIPHDNKINKSLSDEAKLDEGTNTSIVKEKIYLTCKKITKAEFSNTFKDSQSYIIGRGKLPIVGGYGEVSTKGRSSFAFDNEGEHIISVMPFDNKKTESVYADGIITIYCGDGKTHGIFLPRYKDLKGEGFVDSKGNKFKNGFFVGADGSTYYDKELTKLARKAD